MWLVSYNIRYGLGRDGHYDLGRIARSVKGADVIALQEVESYWERSGMVDQPRAIGDLLPDYYWVYGPAFDMDASFRDGDGAIVNRRRQFGTMLLSRTPIVASRSLVFPKLAASEFNMDLGAVEGLIDTTAGPVRFYSLHLSHLRDRERVMQLRYLLDIHRNWERSGGAWSGTDTIAADGWSDGSPAPKATPHAILLGDFNTLPGTEPYRMLTGEAPWDYGMITYSDEFVDSFTVGHASPLEAVYTYSDDDNTPHKKCRIDYCFVSAGIANRVRSARVDTAAGGSDHFPCWVEIDL
jgi:endonuclease/exonuclease/phosphatase family metal-dependent hydrolase